MLSGLIFLALCIAIPAGGSQSQTAQEKAVPKITRYEIVSIRSVKADTDGWSLNHTSNGFTTRGATMHRLVEEAYGIFESNRVLAEPKWFTTAKFDIQAKVDDADVVGLQQLGLNERRQMLQRLLADRFNLKAHLEKRDLPIYALIVGKNGPKLKEAQPDPNWNPDELKGTGGRVSRSATHRGFRLATIPYLAQDLTYMVDRTVVDKTGLTGRYDFELDWGTNVATPSANSGAGNVENGSLLPPPPSGSSVFEAIQEQLGLKLQPEVGPVEILVIDSAELPSEN
jgi:uncharacterized protein (TIGR03435 family)